MRSACRSENLTSRSNPALMLVHRPAFAFTDVSSLSPRNRENRCSSRAKMSVTRSNAPSTTRSGDVAGTTVVISVPIALNVFVASSLMGATLRS